MSRMESPATTKTTISGVPEDLLDEFDDLADAEGTNRSEKLRELMRDAVEGRNPSFGGEEFYPDNGLADLYRAALVEANDDLILALRKKKSAVANRSNTSKTALRAHFRDLERGGYVRRMEGALGSTKPQTAYRVKPACADPDKWKYRQQEK